MRKLFLLILISCSCFAATKRFIPWKTSTAASVENTFDYISSWTNKADGASSTLAVTTASIVAGDLICVWVKNETAQTCTAVSGNVTGAFTMGTQKTHANNDLHGRWAYVVAAGADTQVTVTFSSAAATFRRAIVSVWRPYTTPVLDTQITASGTSTAVSSGNITTAGAGLILGGYAEYSAGHLNGILVGTLGCVTVPQAEWASTFTRSWGLQTSNVVTVATSATLSASDAWVCNAIAFKGSGPRTTTGTNYAHVYVDGTNQTLAATLTTTILNNGTHGDKGTWTLSPATPTGFTVISSMVNKTSPLFCSGAGFGVYNTGDASRAFAITNTATTTYSIMDTSAGHRRLSVSGFFRIGAGSGGSGLFDMIRFDTVNSADFALIQLNRNTMNLGIESNPGGVTTHTAGFTAVQNTIYKYSILCDFQNGIGAWVCWDTSGTVKVQETYTIDAAVDDIAAVKIGQVESGTHAATYNAFEHTMINYMGVYPIQP